MIYHVRHPALPSGGGRGRVGCLSPPDRWWNSEDRGCGGGGDGGGVPWDRMYYYICCPRSRAHGEMAPGISLSPLPASDPLRRGDLCSLSSRCAAGLCEKRLANIDSSWRMEEIKVRGEKGRRRRGLSEKERGNNRCTVLFMNDLCGIK